MEAAAVEAAAVAAVAARGASVPRAFGTSARPFGMRGGEDKASDGRSETRSVGRRVCLPVGSTVCLRPNPGAG